MIRDYRMASTIQQRRDGFLNVLTEYGRSCGGDFELTILPDYKQAKEKVREFLSEKGCCFDGIFTTNDMMALGVYVQSRKMNFQIPEQLSVVGFDNVYLTGALEPPLTTIVQPIDELSEKIVSCALELILSLIHI